MKNPFEKNDHKLLIAGIVIGSVAAGAAAYLFLTATGRQVRGQLCNHFNSMRNTFLGNEPETSVVAEDVPVPSAPKTKAPKSNRATVKNSRVKHTPGTAEE